MTATLTPTRAVPLEIVAPAPKRTTTPLKLSEAVRLGAMSTKQLFGAFGTTEATCAIGAANVAFGREPGDKELYHLLEGRKAKLPCKHRATVSLTAGIIHLNDTDEWPREKIAGWLGDMGL